MESGATVSETYKTAQKLLIRTKDGLVRVESLFFSGFDREAVEVSVPISMDIAQIQVLCGDMERLLRGIPSQGQRGLWKRKVEQVAEEVDSLKKSLDKLLLQRQKRIQEAKERTELLERAGSDSSHVLRIFDEEAQAMESARNSSRLLDESYDTAVAILSKYAEQKDRLKRAQRKALDVINSLGLSGTVLKLIERRHRTDKWIAYGGMILVIVVVVMFWRLTH